MNMKPKSPRLKFILGMLCLYIVWGTPFLARKFAIRTIPPLMEEGVRFVISGILVCLFSSARNKIRLEARHWRSAFIIGGFLWLGGNGAVVWAQQTVASGIAALFIGTVPMWIVIVDCIWTRGPLPSLAASAALVAGFAGVVLLASPWQSSAGGGLPLAESLALFLSALFWSIGSIYAKHTELHEDLMVSAGTQMFAGGLLLLAVSAAAGEFGRLRLSQVSGASAAALLFLIFASIVGFNVYIRLLKAYPPEKVATYAYVNPVTAIFLGWRFAGEPFSGRMLVCSCLIIISVAVIVSVSPRMQEKNPEPMETP